MSTLLKTWGVFCPPMPKWAGGVLSGGCFVLHSYRDYNSSSLLIHYFKLPAICQNLWIEWLQKLFLKWLKCTTRFVCSLGTARSGFSLFVQTLWPNISNHYSTYRELAGCHISMCAPQHFSCQIKDFLFLQDNYHLSGVKRMHLLNEYYHIFLSVLRACLGMCY